MKKVTFGITNCNRLYYLKSCLESLIDCTSDYPNKEIIVVDNASVEPGTKEYLLEKEKQGIKVYRQEKRDPKNEFAKSLNLIYENSTGDYVGLLQGDMQFVVKGKWLESYVDYCEKYKENVGCLIFDAQRSVRINQNAGKYAVFDKSDMTNEYPFFVDLSRPPVQGAGDALYPKSILERVYPWHTKNESHEGGLDSETAMLKKVSEMRSQGELGNVFTGMPKIPVAVAICTDQRGTMGRVRGNKRYGDYWEAKRDNCYYEIFKYENLINDQNKNGGLPLSIEMLAKGIDWNPPIDENGNWKKNPIRVDEATEKDYIILYEEEE